MHRVQLAMADADWSIMFFEVQGTKRTGKTVLGLSTKLVCPLLHPDSSNLKTCIFISGDQQAGGQAGSLLVPMHLGSMGICTDCAPSIMLCAMREKKKVEAHLLQFATLRGAIWCVGSVLNTASTARLPLIFHLHAAGIDRRSMQ